MGIISDMEAEAAASTQVREGAPELLHFLRDAGCRVALVTRNTRASVQAFLDRLGPGESAVPMRPMHSMRQTRSPLARVFALRLASYHW